MYYLENKSYKDKPYASSEQIAKDLKIPEVNVERVVSTDVCNMGYGDKMKRLYSISHLGIDYLRNYEQQSKLQQNLAEIQTFLKQEKQDRIKSDKKQSRITWIGNVLMFFTLIAALIALFK